MSEFSPGDYVVVKDIDGVPEEWRGRKGMVTVVSRTEATVGVQDMEPIRRESNSSTSSNWVRLNGESKSLILPEWMLDPFLEEPATKQ